MDSWIFFTLDGTLIDSRSAEEKAALLILRDILGLNLGKKKQWSSLWNYTYQRFTSAHSSHSFSKKQIWINSLREFDPSLTEIECTNLLPRFRTEYFHHLVAFPDVPEALFRLTDHHSIGLIVQKELPSEEDYDIPAGLSSLFKKIICLPPESDSEVSSESLSPNKLIGGLSQGETTFVSSSYSFLSNIENYKQNHPIWLNRLTSKQATIFRTISNLREII